MKYAWWSFRTTAARRADKIVMWVAWHLPKRLRMWVVVRAYAAAWAKPPYKTPEELGYSDVFRESFGRG